MSTNSILSKIRQEIERLKKLLEESTYYLDNSQQALGYSFALDDFNEFLDTLSEEPDKSLEEKLNEEIKRFVAEYGYERSEDILLIAIVARHFAKWQKEQMLKEAVDGVARPDDCEIWVNLVGYGYKFNDGDKVRLIVLPKED